MRRLDGKPPNCKFKDLTGMVFGKLKVLYALPRAAREHRNWVCQCECGKQAKMFGYNLTNGHQHSCGCEKVKTSRQNIKIAHAKAKKEGTAFRQLYAQYRCAAKRRGIFWELTLDQFRELTVLPCYYTGRPPSNRHTSDYEVYIYSGVDRVDNTKGYTIENCVPCYRDINVMKNDMTKEEFVRLCHEVAERHPCPVQLLTPSVANLEIILPSKEFLTSYVV